jgi:hypothetical protein
VVKKTVLLTLVCAGVLLLGTLAWLRLGGDAPARVLIDEGRAGALALDFFSRQHAPADSLSNVRIVSEKQTTESSGRTVWEVQVSGGVTEPGSGFTYESAMVLDVDVRSGSVSLVARG